MTTALIFDFDGTLVDSEQAIYQCFHSITKQLAPERIEYANKILIGPPLRNTASEILGPKNQNHLDQFVELFIQMHDEQITKHTKPYPQVSETLKKINSKNIPMALATNKREIPTKKLLEYYDWKKYFDHVECSDSNHEIRTKEVMIMDIIKKSKQYINSYYIGDTVGDYNAAKKNNLRFIRALYGYGKSENWNKVNVNIAIEKIDDLAALL